MNEMIFFRFALITELLPITCVVTIKKSVQKRRQTVIKFIFIPSFGLGQFNFFSKYLFSSPIPSVLQSAKKTVTKGLVGQQKRLAKVV